MTSDRDLLERAAVALMNCAASALTVKPSLDEPYPDHPEWTPYTRWVERPAGQATTLAGEIRKHLAGSEITEPAPQVQPYPPEWLDAAAAELARQHHGGPADPDDIKLASEVLAAALSQGA